MYTQSHCTVTAFLKLKNASVGCSRTAQILLFLPCIYSVTLGDFCLRKNKKKCVLVI